LVSLINLSQNKFTFSILNLLVIILKKFRIILHNGREWGMGSGEWRVGSGEWGVGSWEF
jgi:hypothetical protein